MYSPIHVLAYYLKKLFRYKFLFFVITVILLIIIAHDYNNAINKDNPEEKQPDKNRIYSKSDSIVNFALTHQGIAYKYAGKDPDGFDCSGFTYYVYGKFGIDIPRSSQTQFNYGKSLPEEDLKKGDLVFFTSPSRKSKVGHVGIVISDQGDQPYFIHSSSGKAGGVTIDSLGHPHYKARYAGARRLLGSEYRTH